MPKRVSAASKKNEAAQKGVDMLVAYAKGEYIHLNRGNCPDVYAGFDKRDAECVVCQALEVVSASSKK